MRSEGGEVGGGRGGSEEGEVGEEGGVRRGEVGGVRKGRREKAFTRANATSTIYATHILFLTAPITPLHHLSYSNNYNIIFV